MKVTSLTWNCLLEIINIQLIISCFIGSIKGHKHYFAINYALNPSPYLYLEQSLGKCYKLRVLDIAANELRIFPTEVWLKIFIMSIISEFTVLHDYGI